MTKDPYVRKKLSNETRRMRLNYGTNMVTASVVSFGYFLDNIVVNGIKVFSTFVSWNRDNLSETEIDRPY